MKLLFAACLAVLVPARALGLAAEDHWAITLRGCQDADYPPVPCMRMAMVAHNVDAEDWDNHAAHAQRDTDQSLHDGAVATSRRLSGLGRDIRQCLEQLSHDSTAERDTLRARVADDFGKALHTIHDVCTHQGMSNPQHAWYTRLDLCEQWNTSPDKSPVARECAEQETTVFLSLLERTLEEFHLTRDSLEDSRLVFTPTLPAATWLCSFLYSSSMWDGEDLRWDNAVMVPLAREAFDCGLRGVGGPTVPEEGLRAEGGKPVDVTSPPGTCEAMALLCPPAMNEPASCSAAPGSTLWPWLGLVVAACRCRTRRAPTRTSGHGAGRCVS